MSEWQPIETAPLGVKVQLGWWEDYSFYSIKPDDIRWHTRDGVAFQMGGVWPFRRLTKTYEAEKASHWRYLPEPPK